MQGNYNFGDIAGVAFRQQLNTLMEAVATNNSGATPPETTYPHQWWIDLTAGWVKQRNAANDGWVSVLPIGKTGATAEDLAALTVIVDSINGDYFRKNNILGTVSQASGVPTGAIIESGENANGSYIKFADGTLQCSGDSDLNSVTVASGPVYTSSVPAVTFAAEFISPPIVTESSLRVGGSGICWPASIGDDVSETGYLPRLGFSISGATGKIRYIATGRWFE